MTVVSQDQTVRGTRGEGQHEVRTPPHGAWVQPGLVGARPAPEHKEPYRTLSVLSVAVGLIVVPVISLLGHRRLAIICLGTGVLLLALLRLQRPDGTWIAARGRFFDVVFGTLLAVALFALTYYADLPRVV
ncbi:DUF3017 domain-containing protein [Actinomyces sp. oral taxon 448]|jgi:hypothetical protein avisC_01608|uniref:DUF3017 domain-containing protein n=1 Tax=Actinomyces sp. oral taxon 448 TaxID=712124 RepID=UPI0025B89FB8|nr:DUF3017 domain-containing protein [Actinomyces sp. oral taxon 448]